MDDVVKEFIVESYENLDKLDRDFVELEKNPSKAVLGNIFRVIHTVKGTCGFLGFSKLEALAHAGESLLSLLRDGKLQVNLAITDALLAMVDAVREMLACIEATGSEGERDDSALIERLVRHQDATDSMHQAADKPRLGEILVKQGRASVGDIERALQQQKQGDPRKLGEILVEHGVLKSGEVAATLKAQGESRTVVSDSTVRVDVGLLDKLMNLVGELVLTRNQVIQFAANQEDATFLATSQHLNLVTGELQEGIMKTRMQPIGKVWNKFPRVVRDLASACKKQVRVEMVGADTELDRAIIEAIKDPLTHIVRNAVDHGFESPEERVAGGKPAEGRLVLRACHEGGQVDIEIADDGAGIDPEHLKKIALQRRMITPEQAARMSEREVTLLIFLPGFSTTEKIGSLSGRGVGMDVVKTNIEKIGGAIDVQSKPRQGTTLKIKIPLTLAIVPALMVSAGGELYAIPQVSLLELVRVRGSKARKAIEMVHGAPVYRLRGNLLPLVYLNGELKVESKAAGAAVNIAVLQADGHQFGLVVDGISDSKDIVVKPLGKHLKGLTVYSGATIMGDGKVALILNVIGLSQRANVVSETRARRISEIADSSDKSDGGRQALLLCRCGKEARVGIPLSTVARLEEFARSAVEKSKGHDVVQYRGEIMPLIRLAGVLGVYSEEEPRVTLPVVVYRCHQGRNVGLVVEQIVDVVEEHCAIEGDSRGNMVLGTAVVQGKVTDIINVRSVVESVDLDCFAHPEAA